MPIVAAYSFLWVGFYCSRLVLICFFAAFSSKKGVNFSYFLQTFLLSQRKVFSY